MLAAISNGEGRADHSRATHPCMSAGNRGRCSLAWAVPLRASSAARLLLLAALAWFVLAAGAHAASNARIALVVGNTAYAQLPLDNPRNDAKLIASNLRRLGFQVVEHHDLKVREFRAELRRFARQVQDGAAASVFYYAGHGVQIDGRNYLLPVDVNLRDEEEVKDESIDIDELLVSRIDRAPGGARIVILDACRDNPFVGRTRNIRSAGGLAEMSARGALIAFASAPGAGAEDGPAGGNSVYTRNLAAEMVREGVEVEQLFRNVRVKVQQETKGRQMPWVNTSLTVEFSFNPAREAADKSDAGARLKRVENELDAMRKRMEERAARPDANAPAVAPPVPAPGSLTAPAAPSTAALPKALAVPKAPTVAKVPDVATRPPSLSVARAEAHGTRVGDVWEYRLTERRTVFRIRHRVLHVEPDQTVLDTHIEPEKLQLRWMLLQHKRVEARDGRVLEGRNVNSLVYSAMPPGGWGVRPPGWQPGAPAAFVYETDMGRFELEMRSAGSMTLKTEVGEYLVNVYHYRGHLSAFLSRFQYKATVWFSDELRRPLRVEVEQDSDKAELELVRLARL
jgi:hypothetical protein